jgi:hypothetical protein
VTGRPVPACRRRLRPGRNEHPPLGGAGATRSKEASWRRVANRSQTCNSMRRP